ncbi:hypothetical protein BCV69DRAFT_297142 [Microstroma glucosiphilum]|uniref:HORMA domain-containing protein n=1 Tax=Pseudomicrostroma glucosiphilum TaxID=1684307 RepID=A0A316UE94_9BASI|nr:hypothetical protein BCV69DRAFT_297142 [Pseudomicrostroma glucosiphilum]PWN23194.1 hypothetical protein BCV69DRAFT_297142 [Pseudomicrostroma glucosiphilum]
MQRIRPQSLAAVSGQAQAVQNTQAFLTQQESLQTVKDLIEISIGSFTYLRDIFPEDCYKNHICKSANPKSNVTTKKLARGSFAAVDKLLDYLELGVYDALEKRYLSSLILAIHLDKEQPGNVVETYTFNFSYTKDDKGNTIPIMDITDGLDRLAFSTNEPKVAAPTVAEIRVRVQSIIRSLISYVETFQRLPDQKFLYFKVHYNNDCPQEYEPPYFGPAQEHRLQFFTRNLAERPEKMRFGELETGHHKVRASIASVAGLLPEVAEGDDIHSQISLQLKDQAERSVLWDAEQQAEDGFETHPEYDESAFAVAHSLSKEEHEKVQLLGINKRYEPEAPIGYRMSDGRIAPIPPSALEEFQLGQGSKRQGHEASKEENADVEMFVAKAIKRSFEDQPVATELANSIISPFYQGSMDGTALLDEPTQLTQMSLQLPPCTQRSFAPNAVSLDFEPGQSQSLSIVESANESEKAIEGSDDQIIIDTQDSRASNEHALEHDSIQSLAMTPNIVSQSSIAAQTPGQTPSTAKEEMLSRTDASTLASIDPAAQKQARSGRKRSDKSEETCTCGYPVLHAAHAGKCSVCDRRLHLPCYGHLAWKDGGKVPLSCWDHALPSHASDPIEQDVIRGDTYRQLQHLAFVRRALYELHRAGSWPDGGLTAFSKLTGFTTGLSGELYSQLLSEGFLTSSGAGSKKTRRATKQTVLDTSWATKSRFKNEYFSPGGGKEKTIFTAYQKQLDDMMAAFTAKNSASRAGSLTDQRDATEVPAASPKRQKSVLQPAMHKTNSKAIGGDGECTPRAHSRNDSGNRSGGAGLAGQKRNEPDSAEKQDVGDVVLKKAAWARASQCDPIEVRWDFDE